MRGVAGDDDYPKMTNGEPVPFRRSERPIVHPEDAAYILEGMPDPPGGGGHRAGSRTEGKTEFPARWSDDKVIVAIEQTLDRPSRVNVRSYQRKIDFLALVDGVIVKAVVQREGDSWIFVSAYPLSGDGVRRYFNGRYVDVPLDTRDLGE